MSTQLLSTQLQGSRGYHGTFIHSIEPSKLEILDNTLVIVDAKGRISLIRPNFKLEDGSDPQRDLRQFLLQKQPGVDIPDIPVQTMRAPYEFIIPSFVDAHVHAPQFSMRGLGQGLHILDWLDQITFPHEAKFADTEYARRIYERCVDMGLQQGITTACYFGSLHTPATKTLADVCLQKRQRAFIGKTCMDNPKTNPDYYREATEDALTGSRDLIHYCLAVDEKGDFVRPVLTPRFAISCTPESLTGLGQLANEHQHTYGVEKGVINQTHFCEAQQEIDATLNQYPGFKNEADLYEHHGLLNHNSVLAHCTLLSDDDLKKVKALDCGIAHCPISNTTVGGGFMAAPVRRWFSDGMTKVGLGTDSGGGFSMSIMDVMRQALIVGNAREMLSAGKEKRLELDEIFYMATLGGAKVLGMGDRIGSFEVGKQFDAIRVNLDDPSGDFGAVHAMMDDEDQIEDGIRKMWEKWIMTGDDRNLVQVWVGGELVRR